MAANDADIPHPRDVFDLAGHEDAENAFLNAIDAGSLHHAWLIAGSRGIGKATLAYRVARRVLGARPDAERGPLGAGPDDPVCRRIAVRSHADLIVLERPWDDARGRYKGEIPVAEARRLRAFFTATAGEGGWRVAIIDAADEMNANAANAILKTLEEPPAKALLLLVAHAPGRLPATVRSRCRTLVLNPPGVDIAAAVAAKHVDLNADDARQIATLCDGRPGEAARLASADGLALHAKVGGLVNAPKVDIAATHRLADSLAGADGEAARALTFRFLGAHALERARDAAPTGDVEAWGALWDKLGRLERGLATLHLDPKAVMLEAFASTAEAAAGRAPE